MSVVDKQIKDQIVCCGTFEVTFNDDKPTFIEIYDQRDLLNNKIFIKPAFCNAHELSTEQHSQLMSMTEDNRIYNTDPLTVNSNMGYDQFFDRYYNNQQEQINC